MNLSYKQLTFILDIKPVEALEKIILVHCRVNNLSIPDRQDNTTGYLYDFNEEGRKIGRNRLPESIEIDLLSTHLNLPDLQRAVDDIRNNFLARPSSKMWILCGFPEKEMKTKLKSKIKIPNILASLLRQEDLEFIKTYWKDHYGIIL